MAGVKTRRHSDSKLSELVGPGKEFILSEVPTLRAIIQRGILIRDRLLLEQGSAKTDVHTKDIVVELVPLIVAQWQISNAKFAPPVTIKEDSIRKKVERLRHVTHVNHVTPVNGQPCRPMFYHVTPVNHVNHVTRHPCHPCSRCCPCHPCYLCQPCHQCDPCHPCLPCNPCPVCPVN